MNRRMRGLLTVLVAVASAWLGAGRATGDEAPLPRAPKPKPADYKIVVKVDPTAEVSKLVLPGNFAGAPAGAVKPGPRDTSSFWSPPRTMLAGLCLSLAVVSLFFVRSTNGGARLVLLGVVGLSALGLGAAAWANAPPPPGFIPGQPLPGIPLDPLKIAEGPVKIEYTGPNDGPITVIVAGRAAAVPLPIAPPKIQPPNGIPAPEIPLPGNAPPNPAPRNP